MKREKDPSCTGPALSLEGVTVVLFVLYGLPSLSTSLNDLFQCHLLKRLRQRNLPPLSLAVTFSLPVVSPNGPAIPTSHPATEEVSLAVVDTEDKEGKGGDRD